VGNLHLRFDEARSETQLSAVPHSPTLLSPSLPRRTPQPILSSHLADQFAGFLAYRRSSRSSSAPDLAGPEQLKTLPMPGNHGIAFHDDQRRVPVAPNPAPPSPKEPVRDNRFRRPPGGALEHADLMSKGDILQLQRGSRFQ
jgi:hypothetical protein